jgi:hypothetical protein
MKIFKWSEMKILGGSVSNIFNIINSLQLIVGAMLLSACSVLQPVKSQAPATYALEAQFAAQTSNKGELVLQVSTPQARSGYESSRMVYLKKAHELEYFANNQWVDSPAHARTATGHRKQRQIQGGDHPRSRTGRPASGYRNCAPATVFDKQPVAPDFARAIDRHA